MSLVCLDISQVQCIKSYKAQEHDELTLEKADILHAKTITSDGENRPPFNQRDKQLLSHTFKDKGCCCCCFPSRLGGRYQTIRRGTGLVPQNPRGGNHESQRTTPQPSRKYPHQMRHAETEGGSVNASALFPSLSQSCQSCSHTGCKYY